MNDTPSLILVVILTILAAVVVNLLMLANVRTNAKRNSGRIISKMLKAAREPFKQTDTELEELSILVKKNPSNRQGSPGQADTDNSSPNSN
jgi:type II secretory pathway pseudopilin PulG